MAGPSKGSKPDKILRDALILELNRMTDLDDGEKVKKVNRVVHKLVEAAMDGKVDAIREVFDRVEGKATQPVSGDPEGDPIRLVTRIEMAVIDPLVKD